LIQVVHNSKVMLWVSVVGLMIDLGVAQQSAAADSLQRGKLKSSKGPPQHYVQRAAQCLRCWPQLPWFAAANMVTMHKSAITRH
jgi:hypothetical protein